MFRFKFLIITTETIILLRLSMRNVNQQTTNIHDCGLTNPHT